MHSYGVAHLDIKPDNVLIDSEFNLKLADFGMAGVKQSIDELFTDCVGTAQYKAPEINGVQEYDGFKADVYSAGVTLFTMFSGIPPYSKADISDPYYKAMANNDWAKFWTYHEKYAANKFEDAELKSLLEGMMSFDANDRFDMSAVINSKWFTSGTNLSGDEIKRAMEVRATQQ